MPRLLLIALLCLPAARVVAETPEEADLREEIFLRCYYEMGEFGEEALHGCIEADTVAVRALAAYPESVRPIVERCTKQMRGNSWGMVRVCVDNDLAAETALAAYAPEHAQIIDACRAEVGKRGAAKVKACVDRRIGAER
jgi:hypothetical protein